MSSILHRQPGKMPPAIRAAQGLWMTDTNGKQYLDAVSGGAGVSCLGHGNTQVHDAMRAQLDRVAYAHSSFFTSKPAEELADHLVTHAPEGITKAVFCSGGSEAVETALKLARQHWVARDEPGRDRIIARRQSYHGATLGALSVGGNQPRRALYQPYLFDTAFIDPCYAYRLKDTNETDAAYGLRAAAALEAEILQIGAHKVAAFIAEPVVGATLGCAPAVTGYLREIRRICDRYGVLLILDEIMCGAGRTGYQHACLEDGVSPDLLIMAKGLGGGYQPAGAVLVGDTVAQAITDSKALHHGLTYMGHPVACAAALAVQRILTGEGFIDRARTQGTLFRALLEAQLGQHPHVGDIRGRGLFLGVEIVSERASKTPFDPALTLHARIKAAAMECGLMLYPSGGTIDGVHGDHVLLAPAFTLTEEEAAEIVARLSRALDLAIRNIT